MGFKSSRKSNDPLPREGLIIWRSEAVSECLRGTVVPLWSRGTTFWVGEQLCSSLALPLTMFERDSVWTHSRRAEILYLILKNSSFQEPQGPNPCVPFVFRCILACPKMCTAGQRVSLTITGPGPSFLVATKRLYMRVCPSVRPSVGR